MQQYYAVVRELGDITVDDLEPFSVSHAQCRCSTAKIASECELSKPHKRLSDN